jgi:histidyl-tRNA synthetase
MNPGDKLGKQFAYADKLGMEYAIVLGPDEVASGGATIKALKEPLPNQRTVSRDELIRILAANTSR